MWSNQDDYNDWLDQQKKEQDFFRYMREIKPSWFRSVEDWEDCLDPKASDV